MEAIKNRMICFSVDVKDGNPNGDPDLTTCLVLMRKPIMD